MTGGGDLSRTMHKMARRRALEPQEIEDIRSALTGPDGRLDMQALADTVATAFSAPMRMAGAGSALQDYFCGGATEGRAPAGGA